MPNGIDMTRYLEAGLRGASHRQSLIANNLANLDTPGYRRTDTAFEKALADALTDGKPAGDDDDLVFIPGTTPVRENGNDVDLDTEVGEMVKNSAQYKTYIRLLGRVYRQMDLAMRDSNI